MNSEKRKHLLNIAHSFTEAENKDSEIARLTIQNENLTESNRQLREELERVKKVAIVAHPDLEQETAQLIVQFARALCDKLLGAQEKYGYTHGWRTQKWEHDCQLKLIGHLAKGDPRDVANYCAFLWFHNWKTIPDPRITTLTTALSAAKEALEYAQHRARCQYALTTDELATVKTCYDTALARIAECEKD